MEAWREEPRRRLPSLPQVERRLLISTWFREYFGVSGENGVEKLKALRWEER